MKKNLLTLSFLSIINLIIYIRIFPSFQFADDFIQLYDHRFVGLSELLARVAYSSMHYLFRPVHYLFLCVISRFVLLGTGYAYLPMFILHLAASFMVFLLLSRIIKQYIPSMFGAIFFLTYCGNWEVVGWAVVVYYPIVIIFLVSAFLAYLEKRNFVALTSYLLALLTHEVSLIFIPMATLYDYLYTRKMDQKRLISYYILTFLYVAAYIFKTIWLPGSSLASAQYSIGWHFFIQYAGYLATLIVPIITTYSMSNILPENIISFIAAVKTTLNLILPLLCVYALFKAEKEIKFFVFWILLALVPFSFFVTSPVSRYVYVASVGLAGVFAGTVKWLLKTDKMEKIAYFIALFLILSNLLAMITYQELFYKKKEIRREILIELKQALPSIKSGSSLCFVDLPIREDEIKYMTYLWYNNDSYHIVTVNADNVSCKRTENKLISKNYDYIFRYDCSRSSLKLIKGTGVNH